jgi:hypothetical protein
MKRFSDLWNTILNQFPFWHLLAFGLVSCRFAG